MDGSPTKSSANAAGAAANPMLNATNDAARARPHPHNDLNASSKLIGPNAYNYSQYRRWFRCTNPKQLPNHHHPVAVHY